LWVRHVWQWVRFGCLPSTIYSLLAAVGAFSCGRGTCGKGWGLGAYHYLLLAAAVAVGAFYFWRGTCAAARRRDYLRALHSRLCLACVCISLY